MADEAILKIGVASTPHGRSFRAGRVTRTSRCFFLSRAFQGLLGASPPWRSRQDRRDRARTRRRRIRRSLAEVVGLILAPRPATPCVDLLRDLADRRVAFAQARPIAGLLNRPHRWRVGLRLGLD
jgi:hypothetical protein